MRALLVPNSEFLSCPVINPAGRPAASSGVRGAQRRRPQAAPRVFKVKLVEDVTIGLETKACSPTPDSRRLAEIGQEWRRTPRLGVTTSTHAGGAQSAAGERPGVARTDPEKRSAPAFRCPLLPPQSGGAGAGEWLLPMDPRIREYYLSGFNLANPFIR